jgi:hypothetical protein
MKKQSNSLAILAVTLVLGFAFVATFVSCANEPDEPVVSPVASPFEGTWKNEWNNGISHITYIFRGSDFLCVYADQFQGERIGGVNFGTFTFTATTITFKNTWTQDYTLNSITLILEQDAERHFAGTFVKQ